MNDGVERGWGSGVDERGWGGWLLFLFVGFVAPGGEFFGAFTCF